MFDSGVIYGKEKLDANHSWGQRVDIESSVCLSKRARQNYEATRKWALTPLNIQLLACLFKVHVITTILLHQGINL